MTAEKEDIQEIKQTIVSNRVIQIIIAIGTTVAAGCATTILVFLWSLKEQVPLLKQSQEMVNRKVDDLQGSVNAFSTRLSGYSEEQVRQGEKLNFIQSKIK